MSTIKKTTLTVALFFISIITTSAQSTTDNIEFGIKGGVNIAKLKNIDGKFRKGFVFGIFSEYALSDKFSIRSEALFSSQGVKKIQKK